MDDRDALLSWDARSERLADLAHDRALVDAGDAHLFVLALPAAELAFDVALVTREAPEPDVVGVECVQAGEGRREVRPDPPAGGDVEGVLRHRRVADDEPVDELHDVEGTFVDRLVGAQRDGGGDRDAGGSDGREHGVLSDHVVSRRQDVVHGWAAQRPALTFGVGDA